MMEDLYAYARTESGIIVRLLWSDNPPADPDTATAVIGIYSYSPDYEELEGGELDIQDSNFSLRDHMNECLDFIDIHESFEFIEDESEIDEIETNIP